MENKIIYVVTSGNWSEYMIEGVFSTKELAQKFIDDSLADNPAFNEFNEIEEFELDPKFGN